MHLPAMEAIMRALARRFTENEDEWGLAGLLHDIDVELTNADLKVHSKPGAEMAKQLGASEAICRAILVHNEAHGEPRVSLMAMLRQMDVAPPHTGFLQYGLSQKRK